MSKGPDANEIVGMAFLGLMIIFLLAGLACAGLLALYFAKLHEDKLIEGTNDEFYPLLISLGITAVIYCGSAAGAVLASMAGNDIAICDVIRSANEKFACRRSWMGRLEFELGTYLGALFTHHALGFFVELCIGLYAIRYGVKKNALGKLRQIAAPRTLGLQLKAANSALLAISFASGNLVFGHVKYGKLGCDPVGPVCSLANQKGFYEIPAYIVSKIATAVDAWLILPITIMGSFGNQFKLAELYPGIFLGWAAWRWTQSGGNLQSLLLDIRPRMAGLYGHIGEQAYAIRRNRSVVAVFEVSVVSLISLLAGVCSFFAVLWMLD